MPVRPIISQALHRRKSPRNIWVRKRWRTRESPVTVCISAVADSGERIVSACDTRISTRITSSDPQIGRKLSGIRGWTVLASGTLCYAESLLDLISGAMNEATNNDPSTVKAILENALNAEVPKYIAARYLTPFGMDMPNFLSSHGTMFTDERWNELNRMMSDYADSFDVELIVSGWGDIQSDLPHPDGYIYSVSRDGVTSHGGEGFYTCGAGKEASHSLLSFFNYESNMSVEEAVYYVAAAKFMSERTTGVGPNTVIRVAERRGHGDWSGYFLQANTLTMLRNTWEHTGMPRMAPGVKENISHMLVLDQAVNQ